MCTVLKLLILRFNRNLVVYAIRLFNSVYTHHPTKPSHSGCRCALTNITQTLTTTTVVKALVKARTTATVSRAACMKTLASVARGIGFMSGPAASPELAAVSENRLKDLLKALKECETAATTQCTSGHPSTVRAAAFEAVSRYAAPVH